MKFSLCVGVGVCEDFFFAHFIVGMLGSDLWRPFKISTLYLSMCWKYIFLNLLLVLNILLYSFMHNNFIDLFCQYYVHFSLWFSPMVLLLGIPILRVKLCIFLIVLLNFYW